MDTYLYSELGDLEIDRCISTQDHIIWYSEPQISPKNFPSATADLEKKKIRSLKQIMADLDFQKQMEEAAKERSSIAQALLGIQRSLDKIEPAVSQMEPLLQSLEPMVNDLSAWRPGVDAAVGRLQEDLGDIRAQLAKIALGANASGKAPGHSSSTTADAPLHDSGASGDDHGQSGRRYATPNRVLPLGEPILQAPAPTNGTFRTPFPSVPIPNPYEQGNTTGFSGGRSGTTRVECPEFNGDNPTGWKIRCEACFRIGAVDPSVWVDTAVVNFTGAAALWLEWSQAHVKSTSWDPFVASVLEKFGRSEFQQLLRKFSRLK